MTTICVSVRTVRRFLPSMQLLVCLVATGVRADFGETDFAGWRIDQGTDKPRYAAIEPTTNLNIDLVVLACEEVRNSRILQLQVYSTGGPLRSKYPSSRSLKDDPQAEISIDGNTFPVSLLFADDDAVLANAQEGPFPLLSDRIVATMQTGKTMILRFYLLAEQPGQQPSFDGEAIVDLQAPSTARRSPPCAVAPTRRESFESSLLLH